MKLVIGGASGFLGTAWCRHLTDQGHDVVRLVRRAARSGESRWDPYAGKVDLDLIESADVVANLAGAPIAHWPWTSSYRETFEKSRTETTRTLAEAIAASTRKPAFLAQSGMAGYGDCGDRVVTEDSPTETETMFGHVTRVWEAATEPAREAGARVVIMRTSVVLGADAIAVKAMTLPFKLGVGGRIASGRQYFSTITVHDWVRAATYLAESDTASGVYNLTAPGATTNDEFTRALAGKLHRPSFVRVPALPIKLLAGPASPELLGSIRLEPKRLLDEGFVFDQPTLRARLDAVLD